jgi:DNA polymerase/3'-5' exonuclease PolX
VINYRKAMTAIRALDYEITSEEMARKVPRVGKKLAQKIGECISLGRIKKLDHLNWDADRKSVETLFKGIYGVGSEKATEWYDKGLRTIDDVRKVPNLNQNQISGLKYYEVTFILFCKSEYLIILQQWISWTLTRTVIWLVMKKKTHRI